MPDETVRVFINNIAKQGKAWKIDATDNRGALRTYTMHENDRDTGQPTIPPDVGEDVILVYGTQVKEFQGKQETTFWINEVRRPSNPRNGAQEIAEERLAAQEIAEPKKAPLPPENPINASIEWQVFVKEAAATLRANLEWAPILRQDETRVGVTGPQIAAMARHIYYGKEDLQHEEAPENDPSQWPPPGEAEAALADASE